MSINQKAFATRKNKRLLMFGSSKITRFWKWVVVLEQIPKNCQFVFVPKLKIDDTEWFNKQARRRRNLICD